MEKIMVVNLRKVYEKPRTKRRAAVVKLLRGLVARHSSSSISEVKIDNLVTKKLYENGSRKPLQKIRVKITKDEKTGIVIVTLPEVEKKEEKVVESKQENQKEKKENKQVEAKEKKEEEKNKETK